MINNMLAPIQD